MVGQRDARLQPEIGLAVRVSDMDMHSRLFAGKEEVPKGAITDDGWCHGLVDG
jgi:hypothetical protein